MAFVKAYELYKSGIRFYRGIPGDMPDTCLQHPEDRISTAAKRDGVAGGDMVNQMLSGFIDSWQAYPKRTRCVCIATNFDEARSYTASTGVEPDESKVFIALPSDGALMGIAPLGNFWDCFVDSDESFKVVSIGSLFMAINERLLGGRFKIKNIETAGHGIVAASIDPCDMGAFFDAIDALPDKSAAIISMPCDGTSMAPFRDAFADAASSRSFLEDFFDPAKRGFKLRSIEDDLDFLRDDANREVWFASDCLLVRSTLDLDSDEIRGYIRGSSKPKEEWPHVKGGSR